MKWLVVLVALASVPAYAKPETKATPEKAAKSEKGTPEKAPVEPPVEAPVEAEEPMTAEQKLFAELPHIAGPASIDLGNESGVELPEGYVLYEAAAARTLLESWGDNAEGVVAYFFQPEKNWAGTIWYRHVGYVSDSDAGELDAAPMLESMRQATIQQNAKRRALNVAEIFVDDWTDKPAYHRESRRLTWGILAHDVQGKIVNYDTRKLGRNGYLSIRVIDAPESLAAARADVDPIIERTYFRTGSRYEDHRDGDREASGGLRGLVLGVVGVAAAKKAGLLVVILAFLKKAGIFIAGGFAALWKWLSGRNKSEA